tara:strand:- start:4949 stop:5149 length:201 start_codon:yes stop_codon:yes gene_type:complete
MSHLVYQKDEKMGDFFWETRVHKSDDGSELSLSQTWFDGTTVTSKHNIVLMTEELEMILTRIKNSV